MISVSSTPLISCGFVFTDSGLHGSCIPCVISTFESTTCSFITKPDIQSQRLYIACIFYACRKFMAPAKITFNLIRSNQSFGPRLLLEYSPIRRYARRFANKATSSSKNYMITRYREDYDQFPVKVSRVGYYNRLYEKFCLSLDPTTSTALDIGSGPTLNSVIGLAPYISSIVLSEYEEINRKELELWKDNSSEAFDWGPFILAVLSISPYETTPDKHLVEACTEEIRRKISAMVACDVRKKEIIDPKHVPDGGFDIITCLGVLNAAASTMEEFYQMYKNIHSLMRPGGLLVSSTSGRCTYYSPKPPTKYPVFYATDDDVKGALEEAKFDLKEFFTIPIYSKFADVKELYLFVASKQL